MSDPNQPEPVDRDVERRIADAFRALATVEVPTSAPRPRHAPRPTPGADRGSRRRRVQIAGGTLLAVAAAVVIALVLGTEVFDARRPPVPPATAVVTTTVPAPATSGTATGVASTHPTGTPDPTPPPDRAHVEAAFAAVTHTNRSPVVVTAGGWEGVDLDDHGTIRFWRTSDGLIWKISGTSVYPQDVRGDAQVTWSATVGAAALLDGMQHATFLLRNNGFTGDGTGTVIDYGDGDNGWGVIKGGSDGLLHPSGLPVESDLIGLMLDGDLTGGLLKTVDCSRSTPDMASCGDAQYQVVKFWRWDGTAFALDHRSGPAS